MRRFWAVGSLLVLSCAACTRVVDAPQPKPAPPVAPITAGQIGDLLSPQVSKGDGNLFVTVEPQECVGVAREVDPPFIADHHPAAYSGGHWTAVLDGRDVYIEEMVGVYPVGFEAGDALQAAKQTIESCRGKVFRVTSMAGREYRFQLHPPVESGSPDIVMWSYSGDDWACDSAFVAAHNAAVEISTCGPANGYDVRSLAEGALKRIDALANTTA
ncbi:sensor domain-containing protein [Mycobacterium sp. E740]|uniref:sensor domain-containing protein n=1 Tax=Mycobacterium sp. E740 TaxID=1834149 RepID=UPI0007FC8537|nr:sensor domain-containing protein [Mycobacterium sp. E740]OBI79785.1 pknH-like domain protein [Mycobacterium sp. E740]